MGKIIYKQYLIKLHGKMYDILIPDIVPTNMWMTPRSWRYKYAEGSELLGDRFAMKTLKNAYITLALHPKKIIYFPLEDNHPINEIIGVMKTPQLLFYNHNIQFKRSEWRDLKKCLRYRKGKPYVVYYNAEKLIADNERMIHEWKKSKSFFREKKFKEFYQFNTCFFESCKRTALRIAAHMQKEMKNDLDYRAEHDFIEHAFWMGPKCDEWCNTGFYYVNKRFYKDIYRYD